MNMNDFLDFIENKRLVIHNAQFDLSHLNNELTLLGKKKINSEEKFKDILKKQIHCLLHLKMVSVMISLQNI